MSGQSEINDKYLKLAIALKTNELRRNQLSSLTYQHVESALLEMWKHRKPTSISDAIAVIYELDANIVVAYLSTQAVILGSKMKINEFEDLFEGEK